MWIMHSAGIWMPALRPPDTVSEGDPNTIQVRTRRAKDLDILRDEYMREALGPTIATPTYDYNYRAYTTPRAWAKACYDMAMEIDYEKFKPTTESKYQDRELHDVYNSIWSVVTRLGAPGGSWAGYGESKSPTHVPDSGERYLKVQVYIDRDELIADLGDTPKSEWRDLLVESEQELVSDLMVESK